jgi:hypothetical protein
MRVSNVRPINVSCGRRALADDWITWLTILAVDPELAASLGFWDFDTKF